MEDIILSIIGLKEKIIEEINNSNLPAIMIIPICTDILEQLQKLQIEQETQIKNNKLLQDKQEEIDKLQEENEKLKGGKE